MIDDPTATRGAVAAGHEVTADAAVSVLRAGGNAFDAILAGLCAACVAEPVLGALGGGGFLMAHDGQETRLYDFFCDTPRTRATDEGLEFEEVWADFGRTRQAFHIGSASSATPGMIPGLRAIHEAHCTLPMSDLVQPAIDAARMGVTITPFQAYLFQVVSPILIWSESARELFAPHGSLLAEGDQLFNPRLADALEALAQGEEHSIDEAMLASLHEHEGLLSEADFQAYEVAVRKPLRISLRTGAAKTRIWLNPAPAMGGILAAAMLQKLAAQKNHDEAGARAKSIAEVDGLWRQKGAAIASWFGPHPDSPPGPPCQRGTTHISVVDHDGRAASATISNGEGNGRIVPGCGFMINNMLGEEDLNPNGLLNWQPGIRLSSMMTPAIAKRDDGLLMALGSGGSNRIRTAVFQVLANLVLSGLPPVQAVDRARLHFENTTLDVEGGDKDGNLEDLSEDFPDLRHWDGRSLYFGGVHLAMLMPDGVLAGAGDDRRSGVFKVA